MKPDLKNLIEISRKYGSDPEWVLIGGGNTSLKDERNMWVKASGFELATIGAGGFVGMDLDALGAIWDKRYPSDEKARESEVLQDMMNARMSGQTARPSVEALLHSLIRGRYVVHTHPALINGVTCGKDGEDVVAELFGGSALWIPLTRPGYVLASEIKTRLDKLEAAGKPYPEMIFLQNHGLFVGGETTENIELLHARAAGALKAGLGKIPAGADETDDVGPALLEKFSGMAEKAWGKAVEARAAVNSDILGFAESNEAFGPLKLPFNPDQIVYAGPGPVRIDYMEELPDAVSFYTKQWQRGPQAVLVKGLGLFTVGDTAKKAESALALMLDTVKIAVYSESFGGARPMTNDLIIFIRDWEVEHYRAKVGR